jgi:hypothetical protein
MGSKRDDFGFVYGLEEKQWTQVKRKRRRRRGGMIEQNDQVKSDSGVFLG